MRIKKRLFLVVFFASLVLVFGAQAEPLTISQTDDEMAYADTLAYWTPERIAAATPMVMIDTGDGEIDTTAQDEEEVTGLPVTTPSGEAEPGSDAFHQQNYPDAWEALDNEGDDLNEASASEPADQIAGSRNTYTYYDVNVKTELWQIYPHRQSGRFLFRNATGGTSSCSGMAISRNHIVLAAHCVYDTGRNVWHSNMAFTPAYRNGSAPFGTFPAGPCTILNAWINHSGGYSINSWARNDVAVCNAGTNSLGQTLNAVVGWAGRSWNWNYNQLHFNSGYPGRWFNDRRISFGSGQYLRSCTAESFRQANNTLGMGCRYGRGISGGSWHRGYKANHAAGWVNSVNSGLFIGQQNMYGPRFTSSNIVPICNATGC
jgi:V8-like Glu-specific endopeptidase